MDKFNGADIHAPGGLAGDNQVRVILKFPCNNDFLGISAGKLGNQAIPLGYPDVILLNKAVAELPHAFPFQDALAAHPMGIEIPGNAVFRDGHFPAQSLGIAVLWNNPNPKFTQLVGPLVGDVPAV